VLDRVTIKIPRQLYDRLNQIAADSGFSSVNELIVFIVRIAVMDDAIESRTSMGWKRMRKLGSDVHKLSASPKKRKKSGPAAL